MMNLINRIWYQQHWLNYLLRPYGWIYSALSSIRRSAYRHNIYKAKKFNVPVIVVGNITVGGTGKTPLVIALVKWLHQQGYHPGIVSRGYKGEASTWPQSVTAHSNPVMVGDEPVMLAQQTNCPMVVAPNRVAAVEKLLSDYDCNVIVSDDGLQHYALQRDIEIAVIDGERRLGNACCLPAGPLRESKKRLSTVDFVVVNGQAKQNEYSMQFNFEKIVNVADPQKIITADELKKNKLHAVAGIGNPQRFFNQLVQEGFNIQPHPFPDHYAFTKSDIDFNNDYVLMTDKDAVKCKSFADERHWVVRVHAMLDESFYQRLNQLLNAKNIIN